MFKITKRDLWESSGSLARFGLLKFKGKSLAWKASRIHKAATAILEKLNAEHNDEMIPMFGTEVKRTDPQGNVFNRYEVPGNVEDPNERKRILKEYKAALDKLLDEECEIWGDPFTLDELPVEFWGRDEVKDDAGKVTQPEIKPMLDTQDIGALGWMIKGESDD